MWNYWGKCNFYILLRLIWWFVGVTSLLPYKGCVHYEVCGYILFFFFKLLVVSHKSPVYGAPQGILSSAWLGRFYGVKTWNSIFRRVIACTTSSACGVKVHNYRFSSRECVITCFCSRDLAILSCVIAFTSTPLGSPLYHLFYLTREPVRGNPLSRVMERDG